MRGETKTLDQCQDLKKKKKIPVFSPETNRSYTDLGSKATDHFKIEKIKLRVKKKDLLKRNAIQGLWRPDESIYIQQGKTDMADKP